MNRYRVVTYVDITRSNPDRECKDELLLGQQNNFNTLIQAIGLRSNIFWDTDPEFINNKWIWHFEVESDDIFNDGLDPVGLLLQDLNSVPIVSNLTNPVAIYPAVFKTLGESPNTWITVV